MESENIKQYVDWNEIEYNEMKSTHSNGKPIEYKNIVIERKEEENTQSDMKTTITSIPSNVKTIGSSFFWIMSIK